MPREQNPLIRTVRFNNAEKFYILSFEGTECEKKYFADFRDSKLFNNSGSIEIIPLKRPNGRGSDPFSVKKLLQEAKEEFDFKSTDEFWLIIDRDHWETIHKLDFNKLVLECKAENNFHLAMSNPCFEFWLLLHLKDIAEYSINEQRKIYENKKISNSKNYIDIVISDLQGKSYNKRPDPKIFIPKILKAIERAKKLDNTLEDYPQKLGTHIYKIMEKLILK